MKKFTANDRDRSFLKVAIENASEGKPLSVADMRSSIRVLDRIEVPGEEIVLEDADHQYLCDRLLGLSFNRVDRDVLSCIDRVIAATEQERT